MTVARSAPSTSRASAPGVETAARTTCPGGTPYSARIERMLPTSSCSTPKRRTAAASAVRRSLAGHGATLIEGGGIASGPAGPRDDWGGPAGPRDDWGGPAGPRDD